MLTVRRWFCDRPACPRRTFVDQIPGLTVRYQRRTPLLRTMLEQVAVALAGRAGARLAHALNAATSRSSLLCLLMALPDPPAAAPRVLGVDDVALRRVTVTFSAWWPETFSGRWHGWLTKAESSHSARLDLPRRRYRGVWCRGVPDHRWTTSTAPRHTSRPRPASGLTVSPNIPKAHTIVVGGVR